MLTCKPGFVVVFDLDLVLPVVLSIGADVLVLCGGANTA